MNICRLTRTAACGAPQCARCTRNPEQFRDLVARVAGFSEFFVNLTPEMQEDIIARTEHM